MNEGVGFWVKAHKIIGDFLYFSPVKMVLVYIKNQKVMRGEEELHYLELVAKINTVLDSDVQPYKYRVALDDILINNI